MELKISTKFLKIKFNSYKIKQVLIIKSLEVFKHKSREWKQDVSNSNATFNSFVRLLEIRQNNYEMKKIGYHV